MLVIPQSIVIETLKKMKGDQVQIELFSLFHCEGWIRLNLQANADNPSSVTLDKIFPIASKI